MSARPDNVRVSPEEGARGRTVRNAASHRHATQEERITVVQGELRIVVGDAEPETLRAGLEVKGEGPRSARW